MTREIRSIADLTPDAKNANRGTERGRYMLEQSLRETGAGRSIVVDAEGRVIAGNKTLEVAEALGLPIEVVRTDGTRLVVVQRDDLDLVGDGDRARRLAYFDNRSGQIGLEWDAAQMVADLEAGLNLDDMFKGEELAAILEAAADLLIPGEPPEPQIDKADELRQQWQTERGQVWEIPSKTVRGKCHRVMCGDSTSAEDVGWLMGGEKAHLVFTDPPYGVGYEGGAANARKRPGLKNDDADAGWLYEAALSLAMGHLHDKSAFYVWFAASHVETTYAALRAAGIRVKALLIWHKTNAGFGSLNHRYKQKHEPCAYGSKQGCAESWYGPTNEVTVWDIPRDGRNEWHPTQKPIALATRALGNSSKRGDIALDLFLGSGSTLVAAEQTGRLCYGMEIESKYVAVTLQRLADMGLEPRLIAGD